MNTPRTYSITDEQGLVLDNYIELLLEHAEDIQCQLMSQGLDCYLQREDK